MAQEQSEDEYDESSDKPLSKVILTTWEKKSYAKYAGYANRAYCDEFENFEISAKIKVQVLSDPENSQIVIIFRGDEENLDKYLKEKQVTPYKGIPGALVHSGFYENFGQTIRNQFYIKIVPEIKRLMSIRSKKITLVGHSLGGVYAIFAALALYELKKSDLQVLKIFTYGMPRIGNKAFGHAVIDAIGFSRRVTNQNDDVPLNPQSSENFVHFGEEIWISGIDYKIYWCNALEHEVTPHVGESEECINITTASSRGVHNGRYFGVMMKERSCAGDAINDTL
ncbi:hypothetical protein G9A89_008642 [Geosiphon pyriformis]|nr:hypothetical protein G9A89_008642 [Geosiphon pyriformis]